MVGLPLCYWKKEFAIFITWIKYCVCVFFSNNISLLLMPLLHHDVVGTSPLSPALNNTYSTRDCSLLVIPSFDTNGKSKNHPFIHPHSKLYRRPSISVPLRYKHYSTKMSFIHRIKMRMDHMLPNLRLCAGGRCRI